MAYRPCLDCGTLTPASRCEPHRLAYERRRRPSREQRGYGPEWRRLSADVRKAHPWCAACGRRDRLTVDHVVPHSLEQGVRVLCVSCHGRYGARTDR